MDVESAKKFIEDEYSHIYCVKQRTYIQLPVIYMTKPVDGVHEMLERRTKRYDDKLNGIIVAFDNVKFCQESGSILFDQPYIHWDVDVDFYVFRPAVGSLLRANINKMSKGHIGCLIHGCFNMSLPSTDLSKLNIGQEIICNITNLDLGKYIVKLYGEISPKSIEVMKEHGMTGNTKKYFLPENDETSSGESGIVPDQDEPSESVHEEKSVKELHNVSDQDSFSSKSSKKHKKSKKNGENKVLDISCIKPEPTNDDVSSVNNSKKKKHRKRKRESIVSNEDLDANATFEEQPENDSAKRKLKKKDKAFSFQTPVSEIKEESTDDTPKRKRRKKDKDLSFETPDIKIKEKPKSDCESAEDSLLCNKSKKNKNKKLK